MNGRPSTLAQWKERGLFAAVALVLAIYAGTWALSRGTGARGGSAPPAEKQTYARASGAEPLPARGTDVFASADPSRYWDGRLRRVWVEPKEVVARREIEPAKLSPPPATVPAPPMLLPVPGPALEFTGALPRWPEGPPAGGKPKARAGRKDT